MIIKIKDAVKTYGEGNAKINALDGINLELEESKIYTVLGPSGSGKSTFLNMIGGLDNLTSGEIIVDGFNISNAKAKELTKYRREKLGFVFQFYNLIPDLTAKENIEVVSDLSNNNLDINEVMDALAIAELKDRLPRELSGGQQQRIAIARAMIKNPKLLLCDELTGALDSKSSKQVLEFIEKINNLYKTTIIIITHNEEISKMSDSIIRIKDGKIAFFEENKDKISASMLNL